MKAILYFDEGSKIIADILTPQTVKSVKHKINMNNVFARL